jgi:hypothetical protein
MIINKIYNEEKELIEVCNHPKMVVYIPYNQEVFKGDIMRIKIIDKPQNI